MKRIIITLVLCMLVLFSTYAAAQSEKVSQSPVSTAEQKAYQLHLGATSSPEHSYYKATDVFLDQVATHPEMNITAFREYGVHGSDGDIALKVIMGDLQGGIVCDIGIAGIIPEVGFVNLPGLFSSYEDVDSLYLNGWMGEEIRKMCEAKGLLILGFGENDFRAITNSKHPITSAEDLKGIKLRVPPTIMYQTFYQLLGCLPANIAINELAMALQQKVVDGQDNGVIVTHSYGFSEFQKYMTDAKHMYSGAMFIFNKDLYEKMSPEQQQFVLSAAKKTMESQVAVNRSDVKVYIDDMRSKGVEVIESTEQLKKDIAAASLATWNDPKIEKLFGKELMDKIRSK